MNVKILVLGGTGAMGNDLVRLLADENNEIYVTSRSSRESNRAGITYIKGNAADDAFLKKILNGNSFGAIVDFMSYSTVNFNQRVNVLLESTQQYVYFSSSRVYADSREPITEDSDRLLDVCIDTDYLNTDEYALAKARQENILRDSGKSNWTIIRPYITYSEIRLQLGFQEKELWLYRMLHSRTIVFSKDIGEHYTTLTWGGDVAKVLVRIIGNKEALGQIYHITNSIPVKWDDVLKYYLETIESVTGKFPNVAIESSSENLSKVCGRQMQRKYDRLYNRRFDNTKIATLCPEINEAVSVEEGLKACLTEFLISNREFRDIDWKAEGYMDKITHEHTPLSEIIGWKNKAKYLVARYTSYFEKRK